MTGVLGSAYAEFLEIEKPASAILTYNPVHILSLQQTSNYTHVVIAADSAGAEM
jgi:hypothetical protein